MASHSSRAALLRPVPSPLDGLPNVWVKRTAPRPESSLTDLSSCTTSAVEDLIDMLPAVLVGRLEILELLA